VAHSVIRNRHRHRHCHQMGRKVLRERAEIGIDIDIGVDSQVAGARGIIYFHYPSLVNLCGIRAACF